MGFFEEDCNRVCYNIPNEYENNIILIKVVRKQQWRSLENIPKIKIR